MNRLASELTVQCPCCRAELVVDVNLKRVVSHKEARTGPVRELDDAQRLLAEEAAARERAFEASFQAEKNRESDLDRRFREALEQAQKEPITRPERAFDLD
ncbi:MAG TPA: hypothetical protein VMF13_18285 [Luteitalea sp.]|nr:hypothetical protein [Luteitalea sp.]